jgi:hypothetical protein
MLEEEWTRVCTAFEVCTIINMCLNIGHLLVLADAIVV